MDRPKEIQVNDDAVNLNDLVKDARNWLSIFQKNILLICLFASLSGLIGFFIALSSVTKYKAELRFVVKSDGSGSGLSNMLGGFGSVFAGSSGGSPLERTIEIAGSDRIVGSALLSEVQVDGKYEILANTLIRLNKLNQLWKSDIELSKVRFTISDTAIDKMSFPKRKAIKFLESMLIPKSGDGIISKAIDKKSGVVTLAATHENEEFAIIVTKEIFYKLRDFYVEQMITSAANNVLLLQKKVDSLKFELDKVQLSLARNTDQSFGLLFQEDKIELKKLAMREQTLLSMYSDAQKNLETFRFMNDSAMPSLTVIDLPYSPLIAMQRSKVLFTLRGFFFGGFLSFLFIALRRWYKNLMAS